MLKDKSFSIFIFLTMIIFIFIFPFILSNSAYAVSNLSNQYNNGNKNKNGKLNKKYFIENKKYVILNIAPHLKGYINKKNQKVYYYYTKTKRYYYWNEGIWFNSKHLKSMFQITRQHKIPAPLKHGPLLRVKRKKTPAGFAALKVPPKHVKKGIPNAATEHLYNFPLTLHGLVIYQKKFN
ncbi:MAG: hypothetical protein ACYCTB_05460 [bacterium]